MCAMHLVEEKVASGGPLLRPTSKAKAAVFLGVSFLAYAYANAFLYHLAGGEWFGLTAGSYSASIAQPLGMMLLQPLSIFSHPWMVLVTGLLLAVVVVVPPLVACLYHSRFCAFFLLCAMVPGHAPLLALVLGGACVLVAATPLRRPGCSTAK